MLFLFLLKFTLLDLFIICITAHRKASFASVRLYMLWAAYPSVCPSVCHTPVLCQNEGTQKDVVFTTGQHSVSGFLMPRMVDGDDPVQIKVECKEVDSCENSRAVHISPHDFGAVIDSENSSVNATRKWNMRFPTSHRPRSYVTLNFPKMGSDAQIGRFIADISTKNHYKYDTKFHFV